MSTKIYNAYKYSGSIYELQKSLRRMRQRLHKDAVKSVLNLLDKDNKLSLSELYKLLKEESTNTSFSPLNFTCSAVIYIHPKIDFIIIQFFGLPRKCERTISNLKGFKDWHYQNQSDWPAGMTDKEWKQREHEWNLLLPGFSTPSDQGFIFEFVAQHHMFALASEIVEKLRKGQKS